MSKIALVADVHLGNHNRFGGEVRSSINRRAQLVADTLKRAGHRAVELGCDDFFVLGDLFDTHHPIPQLLALARASMCGGMEWHLMVGNHDQKSPQKGDHAMAPLASEMVHVWAEPATILLPSMSIRVIPYGPGSSTKLIQEEARSTGVLLFHAGVADDNTPPWLRDADDSILVRDLHAVMANCKTQVAFAGNWHSARRWELLSPPARIYQVGTLCPTGFDNPGLDGYGLLVTLDLETMEVDGEEIPGPRFLKVQNAIELDVAIQAYRQFPRPEDYSLFVEWRTPVEETDEAAQQLQSLQDEGILAGWEVVPDKTEAERQARTAALQAASQETTEEALSAYVGSMPVAEGIDREVVLRLSRGFLVGRSAP